MTRLSETSIERARRIIAEVDARDRGAHASRERAGGLHDNAPQAPGQTARLAWPTGSDSGHTTRSLPGTYTAAVGDSAAHGRATSTGVFRGAVRLPRNHRHDTITFRDPHIYHDGRAGWISVTDPTSRTRRILLAIFDLDLDAPQRAHLTPRITTTQIWRGTNVRMTAVGADVFTPELVSGRGPTASVLLDDFSAHVEATPVARQPRAAMPILSGAGTSPVAFTTESRDKS